MTTQLDPMNTSPVNSVIHGDCIEVLRSLPAGGIGFALTDPPYAARYQTREGQTIQNDDRTNWIEPAFAALYRVMRDDSLCVSFYGWSKADVFMRAFRRAGFKPVSHIAFVKHYSSREGFMLARHEMAYVLAKGNPAKPEEPISDVQPWEYSGNKLHPTQKPVSILIPIVAAFSRCDDIVLDPFCGSGSTLVAAQMTGRRFIGIELDPVHAETARIRVSGQKEP